MRIEEQCDARVASLAAGFEQQRITAQSKFENAQAELEQARVLQENYMAEYTIWHWAFPEDAHVFCTGTRCQRLTDMVNAQQTCLTEKEEVIVKQLSKLEKAADKLKAVSCGGSWARVVP